MDNSFFNNKIIEGDGEWDPPGGWQPFTLDANSGEKKIITAH